MQVLQPGTDLDRFFDRVRHTRQRVLLLDYDGTLAPFRVERDRAVPWPGVREALTPLLVARHTRVVVISGRAIADLLPLLGLEPAPEIWGSHGWERLLVDGAYSRAEISQRAAEGLAQARAWCEQAGLAARCEQKPASLALHWRGLDSGTIDTLREQALTVWQPLAEESGLVVHPFDGGLELRVPGRDKGVAVRTILGEMDGDVTAAYLGDDLTDEDAFRAIAGRGLAVLVRPELRPTSAAVWLRPPDELLAFLARWQAAATGAPERR